MDREHEFQRLTQAEQDIAEGAEHIKWQREVVGILERISACAEATEGARALLTILIKTQAQREQDGDRIRASLDGDVVSPSAVPLAQAVDHQTDLELAVQREQGGDQIRASLDGDVVSPSTVPLAQALDHQTDLELAVQSEQDGDRDPRKPRRRRGLTFGGTACTGARSPDRPRTRGPERTGRRPDPRKPRWRRGLTFDGTACTAARSPDRPRTHGPARTGRRPRSAQASKATRSHLRRYRSHRRSITRPTSNSRSSANRAAIRSAQASKATRSHLRRYRSHSRSITKKRLSVAAILPSRVKTGRSFRLEQRRDTSGGSSRRPQHGFQIWVARGQNCAIKNSMRKGSADCAATLVSETNPMHGFPQILDSLVQRVSRTEHGGQTIRASADTEWALDKPKGTRDEH